MITNRFPSLTLSIGFHLAVVLGYILLKFSTAGMMYTQKIPIEVFQYPQAANSQLKLQPTNPTIQEKKAQPLIKKVFGVSRKSITTANASDATAEIKQGNTVAKENDNLTLDKNDPDSIPIPTDDYLITSQVALLKDVRIPYPPEAKKASVEGPVVMDLVIDQSGKVKSVQLIRGPGAGLNEAAVAAVKSFEFRPAKVGDQNVAVKIRYTYRFVLENR